MRPEFREGLRKIAVYGLRVAAVLGLAALAQMLFFYLVFSGLEGAQWG